MKTSIGAKTLLYPAPVLVVGSYDDKGKPNVMTAAWGGICCSKPPCVMVALRKATYSYAGIKKHRAFTISIPSTAHAKEADFFGMASGKTTDKFAKSGLTPVRSDRVNAPYVSEFPVVLECELRHAFELGLHTQFVGEVMDVKADPGVLGEDGLPDMEKIQPMLFAPESRKYYGVGAVIGEAFSMGKGIG
jgi:flavin reductase (DIM6/NTAB) family NADH-FMN oxidoreductase RutF